MLQSLNAFLTRDIWRVRLRKLPRHKYVLFRLLRIVLLALRQFDENKCQLRASALTFFTLLSIVPIFAMAFGIAKGFGFDRRLETLVMQKFQAHEQVVLSIIEFSRSLLANTQGGVVAGVGIALLFWTVVKVLGNIEDSFNDIWGVKTPRSLGRRLSDYLSMMLICPVLVIVSSSLTVFIATRITTIAQSVAFLGKFSGVIQLLLGLLPYTMVWFLFVFIYMFMPNTRVSWKAGLSAGIVAGTFYQLAQWVYITFQVGVAQYNAIYGSFAALPLFLVWLQTSWIIVLFGAELSFAVDNSDTYEFEKDALQVSVRFRRKLALRITEMCVKSFAEGNGPLSLHEISQRLDAPVRLIRQLLFDLTRAGILARVATMNGKEEELYQPAVAPEKLTIKQVVDLLDGQGTDDELLVNDKELAEIEERLGALDRGMVRSPENRLIKDL